MSVDFQINSWMSNRKSTRNVLSLPDISSVEDSLSHYITKYTDGVVLDVRFDVCSK